MTPYSPVQIKNLHPNKALAGYVIKPLEEGFVLARIFWPSSIKNRPAPVQKIPAAFVQPIPEGPQQIASLREWGVLNGNIIPEILSVLLVLFVIVACAGGQGPHHGPDYYTYECDGELRGPNPFTGEYPSGYKTPTCIATPGYHE